MPHLAHDPRGSPPRPTSGLRCRGLAGWQYHASRTLIVHSRDCVFLPSLPPSSRALLRSQAGPHAGAWLTAVPCDQATIFPPQAMQIALRRRLRCLSAPAAPAPAPDVAEPWRPCPSLFEDRLAGQTCESRRARLGPRGARGHNSCSPTQPSPASPPKTAGASTLSFTAHCQRRSAVLRRYPGVPPHEDRAPPSMHGGEPCPSRSSSPWRARGREFRRRGRVTALHWTVCSTSPPTRGPAACRCGPRPGPRLDAV